MRKPHIAIIGYGYVGHAMESYFKQSYEITIYDPACGHTDTAACNTADLAVVCVPTPMHDDGSVNLTAVEDTLAWLNTPAIVLKSTVPPGTTERLGATYEVADRLVFSPEYIGEGGYPIPYWEDMPHPTDMKLHRHLIFGGTPEARERALPFFERVSGPFAHYHQTDATTAELTKYMENTWIATKVTFCNEFYDIAAAYNVDWRELRELWLTDGRVGRSHTVVHPHRRGFDGKCIPKDINGLVTRTTAVGYDPTFLRSVVRRNSEFRNASN